MNTKKSYTKIELKKLKLRKTRKPKLNKFKHIQGNRELEEWINVNIATEK